MRIGIDIDGVLANFSQGFANLLNRHEPGVVPDDTVFSCWEWPDAIRPGLEAEGWALVEKTPIFWHTLTPFYNNVLQLQDFLVRRLSDVDVFYVTARGRGNGSILRQTNLWLDSWGLLRHNTALIVLPGAVDVAGKRVNKGSVYAQLNIETSIDDYQINVMSALHMNRKRLGNEPRHRPYLLNREWNINQTDYTPYEIDPLRVATFADWLRLIEIELEGRKK